MEQYKQEFIDFMVESEVLKFGIPSDTKMTDEDLERIVRIIKGLW